MRLEVARRLDDVVGADHPAHAPPRHGVGLRDAVDDHAGVGDLGHEHGHRRELRIAVHQVLVDLVGDDPDAVLGGPATDRGHLVRRVDRARGIGRRDEDEQLGARRARGLELLHRRAVAAGLVRVDDDGRAACELDRLGVRRPVRRREDRLVAGIQERGEGVVERLLAAVGDEHLARLDVVPAVAQRLGGDGLAELGQARGGGVAVPAGVAAGGDRGLDDVVRRGEVGLAGAEADDGAAGCLEGLGLGVDGQGRGLGDGGEAP